MKTWQWVVGLVLCVALIAVGALAGAQSRRLNEYQGELTGYRNELDAMYKRAWWEGVERMASLEIELEKLIISDSPEAASLRLANIARQADGASQNLGQLPVERDGLSAALKFVNQIADYSAALNEGITQGRPISDGDINQLQTIQARLSELNDIMYDLDALDSWASAGGVIEIDVSAIARENMSYPTLIYDGPFSDGARGEFKGLGSGQVSEQQALEIAAQFTGGSATLTGRASLPVPGYEITCAIDIGNLELFVSETGGKVIYMLPSYDMVVSEIDDANATSDVQGAIMIATRYLSERGFENMTANFTQRNEGVIVINFACLQEGVTLYPDLVKVQVSGGRVVGLEAGNYWRNHVERDLPEVTFSYQQALEAVNSRLNIISARLALIPSDTSYGRLDGERLCYEFTCSLGQSRYLVYIDAQTGVEASILKLFDNGVV